MRGQSAKKIVDAKGMESIWLVLLSHLYIDFVGLVPAKPFSLRTSNSHIIGPITQFNKQIHRPGPQDQRRPGADDDALALLLPEHRNNPRKECLTEFTT